MFYRFDEDAFPGFKPVKQTTFHDDNDGSKGNCFQACIASLLGVPIHAVPEFSRSFYKDCWMLDIQKWLEFYGLQLEDFTPLVTRADPKPLDLSLQDYYYLVSGPSPRGDFGHCCIGYKGKIIHDPHPDNTGLAEGWRQYEKLYPIKIMPSQFPADFFAMVDRDAAEGGAI